MMLLERGRERATNQKMGRERERARVLVAVESNNKKMRGVNILLKYLVK